MMQTVRWLCSSARWFASKIKEERCSETDDIHSGFRHTRTQQSSDWEDFRFGNSESEVSENSRRESIKVALKTVARFRVLRLIKKSVQTSPTQLSNTAKPFETVRSWTSEDSSDFECPRTLRIEVRKGRPTKELAASTASPDREKNYRKSIYLNKINCYVD